MKVLVCGASGQLGQRVLGYLRARPVALRLGGRDRDKLQRMAQEGEEIATGSFLEMTRGVKVVLNLAPLGWTDTDRLVEAALAQGCHYLDATGEQAHLAHLLETYDEQARRAGLCVVPSMGLDYALGDCLAYLCGAGHCRELTLAYAILGHQASESSLDFATQGPRGRERVYRGGAWRPLGWELDLAHFDFPPPLGRQRMGRYGSGEVITVPRHTRVDTIRTLILASALLPHPVLLPFFPVLRPLVGWLLKSGLRVWIRKLGQWLGSRRPRTLDPSPGGRGPSFWIVAEARHHDGRRRQMWVRGEDCHQTTAECLALGAELLASGGCPQRGALAPAQLVGDPAEFLGSLTSIEEFRADGA